MRGAASSPAAIQYARATNWAGSSMARPCSCSRRTDSLYATISATAPRSAWASRSCVCVLNRGARSVLARRFFQFGGLLVIELCRARVGRPGADPLPIALESGAPLQHAEHHAETNLRTDIEIGGAEPITHQVIGSRDC